MSGGVGGCRGWYHAHLLSGLSGGCRAVVGRGCRGCQAGVVERVCHPPRCLHMAPVHRLCIPCAQAPSATAPCPATSASGCRCIRKSRTRRRISRSAAAPSGGRSARKVRNAIRRQRRQRCGNSRGRKWESRLWPLCSRRAPLLLALRLLRLLRGQWLGALRQQLPFRLPWLVALGSNHASTHTHLHSAQWRSRREGVSGDVGVTSGCRVAA